MSNIKRAKINSINDPSKPHFTKTNYLSCNTGKLLNETKGVPSHNQQPKYQKSQRIAKKGRGGGGGGEIEQKFPEETRK